MNSASAKFLRGISVDDAFFSLKEDVLGGFGGGTQYTVTSEKLDNLALMHVKINVLDTVCAYRYKAPPHSEHIYKTLYKHMQPQHPTTNHFDPPLYTVSIMCYNTYTKHFE